MNRAERCVIAHLGGVSGDGKQDQTDPLLRELRMGLGESLDGRDKPLGGHSDDDGGEDEKPDGESQVAVRAKPTEASARPKESVQKRSD